MSLFLACIAIAETLNWILNISSPCFRKGIWNETGKGHWLHVFFDLSFGRTMGTDQAGKILAGQLSGSNTIFEVVFPNFYF